MKIMSIIIVLACFCFPLCSQKKGNGGGESEDWTTVCQKEIAEITTDLVVKNDAIIFLSISPLEHDLQAEDIKKELDNITDRFSSSCNKVKEMLKGRGIQFIYAVNKNLVFRYSNGQEERLPFDTHEFPVAMALFSGEKMPKMIYFDAIHEQGPMKTIMEYFGIDIK